LQPSHTGRNNGTQMLFWLMRIDRTIGVQQIKQIRERSDSLLRLISTLRSSKDLKAKTNHIKDSLMPVSD